MSINFFSECCCTVSSKKEFGLYDKPNPSKEPAIILEEDKHCWIGIVENIRKRTIKFYAIDHCIDLKKDNGDEAKKCDGLLKFDNNIVFVELKDRRKSRWLQEAIEQLISTIEIFKANHSDASFQIVSAYVCNKKRPQGASSSHINLSERFKDETGIRLYSKQTIII